MDSKGLIPRKKKKESSDLVNQLNKVLASMQVLYNNIHAAHWNLECHDFIYLHKHFDEIYESTGSHIDVYAEYVRINDDFPVHTYKKYLELSLIEEVTFKETNERKAIFSKMISDTEVLLSYLKQMFKDTEDNPAVNDYVATTIDDLGKRLWFFRASVKEHS